MRIHRILPCTAAEGPGKRAAIWAQGCAHACPGCFARDTWDPTGGTEMDVPEIVRAIEPFRGALRGITLLGGEPFDQAQAFAALARWAHENGLDVIAFTGYRLETLRTIPAAGLLLRDVDLLLDGEYVASLRDFSRPLVGSENQRFHYLTNAVSPDEMRAYRNRIEVRADAAGRILLNGMGDMELLRRQLKL